MKNVNLDYVWEIDKCDQLTKQLFRVRLSSSERLVNLQTLPFKIYGKSFNIREPSLGRDIRQYTFVYSLQTTIAKKHHLVLKMFCDIVKDYGIKPAFKKALDDWDYDETDDEIIGSN